MIRGRQLTVQEVGQVWTIDRSELITHIYYHEEGTLVLKPERYDMRGWPPGEAEKGADLLRECVDCGGWAHGLLDGKELIGAAVLGDRLFGEGLDRLQLVFLHVSLKYRKKGLGRRLFTSAMEEARRRGAKQLYISATPSKNTVDFYQSLGCTVTSCLEAALFAQEPKDIHLECEL